MSQPWVQRPAPSEIAAMPAQLCWQAIQLCRALEAAAEQLQVALAEAADHASAAIEIALLLDRASPNQ